MKPEYNLTDPFIHRVPTANPIQLIYLISVSVPHWIERTRKRDSNWTFFSWIGNLRDVYLTKFDVSALVCLTFTIHFLRQFVTRRTELWVAQNHIFPRYEKKFPESVWKLVYYGLSWLFALFVHTSIADINSFIDPVTMWKGWEDGNSPPIHPAVLVIYGTQAAFYIHSIYATLYLDLWRKDSWLMFAHHFVALSMLLLSYVDNFTLCGALLLFLQDSSDAMLEMAKIGMYMRRRKNGCYHKYIDLAGSTVFVLFALNWMLCRLYWYPCKLLYGTLYGAVYLGPQVAPFFPVLGFMLILIYAMNIYWFNFIARMLWRVATTGEEPEDNREWDTTAVTGLSKSSLDAMAAQKKQ